ncbi:MAG: recombinase A [Myxococcales bacterium]|nr:recombinase A [Myxococcales bacterium]
MGAAVLSFPEQIPASALEASRTLQPSFTLERFAGRLIELSTLGASAASSFTFLLVHQAQRAGEPVAWVLLGEATFYPPDVAAAGIDLNALPIIRVSKSADAGRAATHLLRSGAFGLIVLDLGAESALPTALPVPLQSRLEGLARKHDTAVVCLTRRGAEGGSLGPLISWRGEAHRQSRQGRQWGDLITHRDKRGGSVSRLSVDFNGPLGLDFNAPKGTGEHP